MSHFHHIVNMWAIHVLIDLESGTDWIPDPYSEGIQQLCYANQYRYFCPDGSGFFKDDKFFIHEHEKPLNGLILDVSVNSITSQQQMREA